MSAKSHREVQQKFPALLTYLLCVLGILLDLPVLGLLALAFFLPITGSGIGYLSGSVLLIGGLILAPWARRFSMVLTMAGVIAITLVASMRLALAQQDTTANIRIITLPQGKETRWVNYLIDEQDSLIFGEALFHFIGGDSSTEHESVAYALLAEYSAMRAMQSLFPSPIMARASGRQVFPFSSYKAPKTKECLPSKPVELQKK